MKGILLSTEVQDWQLADYRFGVAEEAPGITQEKVLSDRRSEGGGVAYLLKFTPPHGRLIRLVATARSDEHVFILEGGYCDKRGKPRRFHRETDFVDRRAPGTSVPEPPVRPRAGPAPGRAAGRRELR